MPGPAFKTGDSVSLHPIEEEDYEFLQYGRNDSSTRIPLTNTLIRRRDDVADRVEDADHHYLVCVAERSEATKQASDETASSAAERSEATKQASSPNDEGDDPEPVGVVAFTHVSDRTPRSASLMYWIAPEHRRNGYVSEAAELFLDYAFRECGFHKVTAQTLASNEASVQALEALGFEREGHLRDEEFVHGEYADTYRYAVLDRQWLDA